MVSCITLRILTRTSGSLDLTCFFFIRIALLPLNKSVVVSSRHYLHSLFLLGSGEVTHSSIYVQCYEYLFTDISLNYGVIFCRIWATYEVDSESYVPRVDVYCEYLASSNRYGRQGKAEILSATDFGKCLKQIFPFASSRYSAFPVFICHASRCGSSGRYQTRSGALLGDCYGWFLAQELCVTRLVQQCVYKPVTDNTGFMGSAMLL